MSSREFGGWSMSMSESMGAGASLFHGARLCRRPAAAPSIGDVTRKFRLVNTYWSCCGWSSTQPRSDWRGNWANLESLLRSGVVALKG